MTPDLDVEHHAAFVWLAWGISALALALLAARASLRSRRWRRELERLESDIAKPDRSAGRSGPADGA